MAEFAIGQRAAIYQTNNSGGMCWSVTVERDTKLYWVADGRKFRKADGLEPGSDKGWDRGRYLLPLDDERVIEATVKALKMRQYNLVLSAVRDLSLNRESPHAIGALREALDAYSEALQPAPQELPTP